jgi:hypothetical protein
MWRKRGKRGSKLSRQLALGLLEDAMGRVEDARDPSDDEPAVPAVPLVPAPRRGGLIPERLARLGRRRSA